MNMKWIGLIVLAIIGVLAAIAAVEYLTLPIHSLPSILGGKHVRGHYHKRGYAAVAVAVVAFGGAIYLALRIRADGAAAGAPASAPPANPEAPAASTDSLLSDTTSAPATPAPTEPPTDQ
jgi:hypothetical protein